MPLQAKQGVKGLPHFHLLLLLLQAPQALQGPLRHALQQLGVAYSTQAWPLGLRMIADLHVHGLRPQPWGQQIAGVLASWT